MNVLAEENPALRGIDINRDASGSVSWGMKEIEIHLPQTELVLLPREDGVHLHRPVVHPVHAGCSQTIVLALDACPVQFMGDDLTGIPIPP